MILVDLVETFNQGFVTRFVFELALVIKDRLRKVLPDFIAYALSRKLARSFFEIASEFVVCFWPASETDDLHGWGEFAVGGQVIQCGDEFAMGEIPCGAEDHNGAWLRNGARGQPFAQRVRFRLISSSVHGQRKLRSFSETR